MVEFTEREDRVSLELSEEIIQSMEPGAVFRDYVILSPSLVEAFGLFPLIREGVIIKDRAFVILRIAGSARLTFTKLRLVW